MKIAFTGYTCLGLLVLALGSFASNRRCFPLYEGGLLCFIQPNSLLTLSWSDALQWCGKINATLPITDTYNRSIIYLKAIGYFGLLTETLWIGANSTYDQSKWYWGNGSLFTGTIENGNMITKTLAYIMKNGTSIKFVAASPFEYCYKIICRISRSEVDCIHSEDSYWIDETCYHLYSGCRRNRFNNPSNCGHKNSAPYDYMSELLRRLHDLDKVWVDLSCNWWTWQDIVTDTSSYMYVTQSNFGYGFPNSTSAECLASSSPGSSTIWWINQGCDKHLKFICQQYVNNDTESTQGGSITKNFPTITTTTVKSSDGWFPNSALIIGLMGGMFLIITIWLALFTAYVCRKIRNAPRLLMQRQSDGNLVAAPSNSCTNNASSVEPESTELKREDDTMYESLELQAQENLYQPMKMKKRDAKNLHREAKI